MSGDAIVDDSGIRQLLGRHQREAARRREEQLENATVSLYRRLWSVSLADEYDRVYGRPVDEDARTTTYSEGQENRNPTSPMAGPMTWNR